MQIPKIQQLPMVLRAQSLHQLTSSRVLYPGTEGLNSEREAHQRCLGLPVPGLKSKAQAQALTLSSPTVAPENTALTLLGGGHHHRPSRALCAPRPPSTPGTYPQVSTPD